LTVSHRRRSGIAGLAAMTLLGMGAGVGWPARVSVSAALPATPAVVPAEARVLVPAEAPVLVPGVPAKPDTVRRDQWQLTELRAETAWQYADGDGVVVGVLDSGVDAKHPDLIGQVLPGLDLVTTSRDGRFDPVGHGTTVAGLIAGSSRDDKGALGLAPGAKILPVRVLDPDNRYEDAMVVAQGVRWAVDHGARVLNLSLGGVGGSAALAEALDYAFAKDVVVIACTGNVTASAPTDVWYPAREPGVVAVSGLDRAHDGTLWASSITGPATVISAPATSLVGARPGGYWRVQGTSFAAPLVTATAALIRSRWPGMSAANVVNRLISTARDIGPVGRDESYGFGAVDPVAALTRDLPAVERNPLDTSPPPGVAGFGPAPGVTEEVDARVEGTPTGGDNRQNRAAGAGAEPVTGARPQESSPGGGLLGGMAAFVVLVTGGVLVIRRLDRPL
jgi:type VII secretion-associated serine protease mycosin